MLSTQLRQKLVFPINPRKKIGQYIQFPLPICWTVGRQAEEAHRETGWLPKTLHHQNTENLAGKSRSSIMGRKAKPSQSPCRGKEVPKLLSKDRNRQMTILQQKNLRATSEENLKQWTSVASTSRQTQEGPIPPVVTTALLHQTSIVCVCEQGEPGHSDFPLIPLPMNIFY